ncbi:MAG: trehalose-6-phosphate synthase [Betaproteobacteria bacterium RIFCSPLOWO2_02_FULL_65_24]|nr:MAG: trehalose-6-phosphate synthase [Betaproteobacteria bacterium RIFCSPLOWO2_02_FULL_65_24]
MRLTLRFVIPLALTLAAIAYAVIPLVDRLTLRWFLHDVDIRVELILNTIQEPLYEAFKDSGSRGGRAQLQRFLGRILQDERLYAVGFCDVQGKMLYKSPGFPDRVNCAMELQGESRLIQMERGPLHVAANYVEFDGQQFGRLVLVHDMSFVQRRSEDTKKYLFLMFVGIAAIVSFVTVVIAQLSWRGWVAGLKGFIKGEPLLSSPEDLRLPELRPVARDIQTLIHELELERRARDASQMNWTPETLRSILHEELKGEDIIVVANREPYIHVRRNDRIEVQRPASGLVTALEPVVKACSGIWIAHASGNADREVVDERDHVQVPPGRPAYRLRRIWLSREEEAGYYYGFANSGLWPLCHIAHVRPVFRSSDWDAYVAVNRIFAEAVVAEAKSEDPIVLVQDYHFALLPRMLREKLPQATVISFWHIPWPNPEAFGICPWREAILDGLLGSSILGFHTQFHCNNFLDTVDRYLEARVDRESFSVSYGGEATAVHRYPISIEWPLQAEAMNKPVEVCREAIRGSNGLPRDVLLGVGVDRMDYTKGILERLAAVERLFELRPQWLGKFSFVQIAAPSRSSIDEYQALEARVRAKARAINDRFMKDGWLPLVLKVEHHDPEQIYEYYRACDVCFVSSLHDGMNLVAKEFIASRDDERGVLLLSQFTGASKELAEALIVNPYNVDQCAAALHIALTMSPAEQRDRMRSMRALTQEFNVYRWAGRMLLDAAQVRRRQRVLARSETGERRFSVVRS